MDILDYAIPEEDRLVFVKIMAYIAQIDNKTSLEEKHVIDDMIFTWRINEQGINDIYEILEKGTDLEILLSSIQNKKTGYLLIQELVTLASIDNNYDNIEKEAISKIASKLAISSTRVKSIEQWVSEGINWRERGLKLIQPEGE